MSEETGRAGDSGKSGVPSRSVASTTAGWGRRVKGPGDRRPPGWRSADIVRAVALAVLVVSAAVGVWEASTMLVESHGRAVRIRYSLRRGPAGAFARPAQLGAVIVVLAVAWILALIGALIAPTLSTQGREIRARLPDALHEIERWVNRQERSTLRAISGHIPGISPPRDTGGARSDSVPKVQGPAGQPEAGPNVASQVTGGLAGVAGHFFDFVGSTVQIAIYLLLILFLAVYIATNPGLYHRELMSPFPHDARARAGEVLTHIASVLRQWLLTQLIAMITLGVVWAIALSLLSVKAAFALAVIARALEFVPTIGPRWSIPALAMALLDSPAKALSVLGVYLSIQGLESNLLIPLLMQRAHGPAASAHIIAQAIMTLAFGFLGLLVAVPLLAAIMVPVKLLYVEDVVGDQVMEEEEAALPDT